MKLTDCDSFPQVIEELPHLEEEEEEDQVVVRREKGGGRGGMGPQNIVLELRNTQ